MRPHLHHTFVKKPRQRYGVSYVFCLSMAHISQQKDSALVLYGYLCEEICGFQGFGMGLLQLFKKL